MKGRVSKGAAAAVVCVLLLTGLANAHSFHWTSGTAGTHTASSHTNNPGHLSVVLKSPSTGQISSGGVFHDGCTSTSCKGAWASWAGDWALDISAAGGTPVNLNLDIDGWATGGDPVVNPNAPMSVWAVAGPIGNFRSDQGLAYDPACDWQQFDIKASYVGTNGTPAENRQIGSVWFAHIDRDSLVYAPGTIINTNLASKQNPNGTGTIQYLTGRTIGVLYDGEGTVPGKTGYVCSSGPHLHLEGVNAHSWGNLMEWHSQSGPDGYSQLGLSNPYHVHAGTQQVVDASGQTVPGYRSPLVVDSVIQDMITIAKFGAGTTSFKLSDNPLTTDH